MIVHLMAALPGVMSLVPPPAPPAKAPFSISAKDQLALEIGERDLCGKRVALLGEGPTHGDGHTEAFKVELVKRLVSRCGYRAIAFESGVYDFIALNRALRAKNATPAMVADAVGALWKFDREFQPLIDFLFPLVAAGQIKLAGLDFQIGGLGESFTNEQMIPELTLGLPPEQANSCRAAFDRHIKWAYSTTQAYGPAANATLLACVAAMKRAVATSKATDDRTRKEQTAMLQNLESLLRPGLGTDAEKILAREDALYQNFASFAGKLVPQTKIIIWGATTHLAKDPGAAWGISGFRSLGARVHDQYGDRAVSVGFSALKGSYRQSRKQIAIAPPPPLALELEVISNSTSSAVYLNLALLRAIGTRPAAALDHVYRTLDWSQVMDAMVIFEEE
ncbi:MAG: erythromycin esterase family protein, partial [Sphingomonas sp.]|nr:erythromycin esterase family protein [Sphingomonas sp.]